MFPVISLGPLNISSFGLTLALGFLFGVFLIWRLARAWDLNEERILDLTILTFLGGVVGARAYFILGNFNLFGFDILKWILIHKYQGFSFWGAIVGGVLVLKFYAKKFRVNFWQALDFAAVGFLAGLIFLSLGCFFGGCNIGISSKLFFALPMVGAIGVRIPIQLFESFALCIVLSLVWRRATHFHIHGTIASFSLISVGAITAFAQIFKQIQNRVDTAFSVLLIILGVRLFYKMTKRKILTDARSAVGFVLNIIRDRQTRKIFVTTLRKSWYNYQVGVKWNIRQVLKFIRRINVRFSHKDSKYY